MKRKSIERKLQINSQSKKKNYFLLFTFYFLLFTFAAFGQDDPPKDVAPYPEKVFSDDEKKALNDETGIKTRTDLSLRFMDTRLSNALFLAQKPNFKEALSHLGTYQLLLEDALKFLKSNDTEKDKVQNTLKKFEITLRKHTTRLEIIRREMPYKYGWHVERIMKLLDDARDSALDPLFSDSVVKTNQ
jgi:hypothetical protein